MSAPGTLPTNLKEEADGKNLLTQIAEAVVERDRLRLRVTDLLHTNNQYLDRARRAEARVDELERYLARQLG